MLWTSGERAREGHPSHSPLADVGRTLLVVEVDTASVEHTLEEEEDTVLLQAVREDLDTAEEDMATVVVEEEDKETSFVEHTELELVVEAWKEEDTASVVGEDEENTELVGVAVEEEDTASAVVVVVVVEEDKALVAAGKVVAAVVENTTSVVVLVVVVVDP